MRKEDILLFNLARKDSSIDFYSFSGIDWDYFLKTARSMRIAPFIYYNIKDKNFNQDIVFKLKEEYKKSLFANILILDELKKVADSFFEPKIEFILLKGAALIQNVYPDFGVRPLSDLDLLIKFKDLKEANTILENLGFTPLETALTYKRPKVLRDSSTRSGSLTGFRLYEKNSYKRGKLTYIKNSQKFLKFLDLHWELESFPFLRKIINFNLEEIFDRAEEVQDKKELRVLSPFDNLIYLCVHLSLHHSFELFWLLDIYLLIDKYYNKINWQDLILYCEEHNIENAVYFPLYYTKKYFKAAVPDYVLDRLKKSCSCADYISRVIENRRIKNLNYFLPIILQKGLILKLKFLYSALFDRNTFPRLLHLRAS